MLFFKGGLGFFKVLGNLFYQYYSFKERGYFFCGGYFILGFVEGNFRILVGNRNYFIQLKVEFRKLDWYKIMWVFMLY